MGSGVNPGYLENAGRFTTLRQSLAVAGAFDIEFPDDYAAFAFKVAGATIALDAVRVGFGKPDLSGIVNPSNATQYIDPAAFGGVKGLPRPTRWVTVYVITATPSAYLEVTGVEGEPIPRAPYANEILASLTGTLTVAANATIVRSPLVWTAGVRVALGAASATILAANALRRAFRLVNSGGVAAAIRLEAAAAVFATHLPFAVGAVLEEGVDGDSCYKGEIRGITAGAAGEAFIQEAT